MTTTFTASNGVEIEITEIGGIFAKSVYGHIQAGPGGTKALREYFQHERDRELGRWRDPDNPNLVVYRRPEEDDDDGRAVLVLDDSTGVAFTYWEKHGLDGQGVTRYEKGQAAAGRYFAAYRERDAQDERVSMEVLNEYRRIAAWLESQAALRGATGDTMHGLAAEALATLIDHEYSRHTIPLYEMLDVVDGALDEKVVSTDPEYAATYAEQVSRAEQAEAGLKPTTMQHGNLWD